MAAASVFSIANLLAMAMWILMIVLPKWTITKRLIRIRLIPILLSLIYAIYIVIGMSNSGAFDFSSLESVMSLFTQEDAVLAGWVHYLAFDLLVGMWILDQNEKIGINQLLLAPILFATFMLGPIGFLLFTIARSLKKGIA